MIVRVTTSDGNEIGPLLEVVKEDKRYVYCQFVNEKVYGGPGVIFLQSKDRLKRIDYYSLHVSKTVMDTVLNTATGFENHIVIIRATKISSFFEYRINTMGDHFPIIKLYDKSRSVFIVCHSLEEIPWNNRAYFMHYDVL